MQVIYRSRWLANCLLSAAVVVTLSACGSSQNVSLTSSLQSGPAMTTAFASPSVATYTAPSPMRSQTVLTKSSLGLAKEVRSLESQSTPGSDGYRIGPQDVLEISVYQAADMTKSVQVAETGTINLPLLGDVKAGGLTARELEGALRASLGQKYFQRPQVTVFIKEHVSQRVIVDGYVRNPGVYPYRGPVSLLQLVATAGGVSDLANESDVMVFRTSAGVKQAARFDIEEIKAGRAVDPSIMQGDIVIVNASGAKKLYQDMMKALPLVGIFGMIL